MICTVCGAELPEDAVVCDVCGFSVSVLSEEPEEPVVSAEENLPSPPPEEIAPVIESSETQIPDLPSPPGPIRVSDPPRRRGGLAWDITALILVLLACAAAFYPLCRDFARLCVNVSEAVESGDVLPVEGMVFASLIVLAGFAADFSLSLRNVLRRESKRVYCVFSIVLLFTVWLFARINETPAGTLVTSEPARALLFGCRMFFIKDYSLIALLLLTFSLCAQIKSASGGGKKAKT